MLHRQSNFDCFDLLRLTFGTEPLTICYPFAPTDCLFDARSKFVTALPTQYPNIGLYGAIVIRKTYELF